MYQTVLNLTIFNMGFDYIGLLNINTTIWVAKWLLISLGGQSTIYGYSCTILGELHGFGAYIGKPVTFRYET